MILLIVAAIFLLILGIRNANKKDESGTKKIEFAFAALALIAGVVMAIIPESGKGGSGGSTQIASTDLNNETAMVASSDASIKAGFASLEISTEDSPVFVDLDLTAKSTAATKSNPPELTPTTSTRSDLELEYIISDDGVTITRYNGSSSNYKIPSILWGKAVVEVSEGAFSGNQNIVSVVFPSSIRIIGNSAFRECKSLVFIDMQYGCEEIGDYAFGDCNMLGTIVLPGSIKKIGEGAFYRCNELVEVSIPSSVEYLDSQAFVQCKKLNAVSVEVGNRTYSSVNGVVLSSDGRCVLLCPSGRTKPYTVIEGVVTIGGHAFEACTLLQGVALPESLLSIQDWAFFDCWSLKTITIPANVQSIGNYAFSSNWPYAPETVYFEGSAPKMSEQPFNAHIPTKVYYHSNASGWDNSILNEYPTATW